MKIEIASQKYNSLLKRSEVNFEVKHNKPGGTPQRLEVRKMLSSNLKKDPELVYIKRMETKTGSMTSVGEANIYDSLDQANLVEQEHIILRNTPPEKIKEEGD